jgi:hypothetical protein
MALFIMVSPSVSVFLDGRRTEKVPGTLRLIVIKGDRRGREGHALRHVRQQSLGRLMKERVDLLTAYAGKVVQKFVDAIAAFEIVDECLYRHSGADEHRCSTQDLGV